MSSFYIESRDQLEREIERLGLAIDVADDPGSLLRPLQLGTRTVPNRLCAQPMAGDDAEPDGSPGDYTIRRYQRLARGGFGTIWFEATAVASGDSGDLRLHETTADAFARCVDSVRNLSPHALLILQLWRSAGSEDPEQVRDEYVAAATLAAGAGFDGVDVACCHGNFLSASLAGFDAPGLYGGPLENRARLLREIIQGIRATAPTLVTAVRLDTYQARTRGFGVDEHDYRRMDLAEPLALSTLLHADGLELLSVTAGSPNLFDDASSRATTPLPDAALPHQHPLTVLARHQEIGRRIREATPGLAVVGGGYTWLRHLAADAAAAAITHGAADIAGFGRIALPYAQAPADLAARKTLSPGMCSLLAFAETALLDEGGRFGQTMGHDTAYRDERIAVFDGIHALHSDDEWVTAFHESGIERAYEILRRSNPLPEMSSHIQSEPGRRSPDSLRHLQFMIAWTARSRGRTGVHFPDTTSGNRIAVIGGGPAGIAATVALLERGHEVSLFEREDRLGGAPALVYPEDRSPDPTPEIDALLEPAIAAGRLVVAMGEERSPSQLTDEHDAIVLATGRWEEASLGTATGVWPALAFLKAARRGELGQVPARVVLLCGGDAAMDAAVTARALGAETTVLLFESSRANAHWHLPDAWFESTGVRARFDVRPAGYEIDDRGAVHGVLLEGSETVSADMVIEAMGLDAPPVDTTSNKIFTAGGCVNGGASVDQCMREGLEVAQAIDAFLRPSGVARPIT